MAKSKIFGSLLGAMVLLLFGTANVHAAGGDWNRHNSAQMTTNNSNSVDVNANTGNNRSNFNTVGGTISTGDINSSVDVTNDSQNSGNTGSFGFFHQRSNTTNNTDVNVGANTGGNSSSFNTIGGNITTGSIGTGVDVNNVTSGNGFRSNTSNTNTIGVSANTGGNQSDFNTIGGNITTGGIDTNVGVTNVSPTVGSGFGGFNGFNGNNSFGSGSVSVTGENSVTGPFSTNSNVVNVGRFNQGFDQGFNQGFGQGFFSQNQECFKHWRMKDWDWMRLHSCRFDMSFFRTNGFCGGFGSNFQSVRPTVFFGDEGFTAPSRFGGGNVTVNGVNSITGPFSQNTNRIDVGGRFGNSNLTAANEITGPFSRNTNLIDVFGGFGNAAVSALNHITGPFSVNRNEVNVSNHHSSGSFGGQFNGLHNRFVTLRHVNNINNNVLVSANTGSNNANFNTIGGRIQTGDITTMIGVQNE